MKKNYLLSIILLGATLSEAQVADTSAAWAYMGGSTTVGANTSVGALGSGFAPANRPRNRYYAHTWMDKNNRIWLFGGSGGTNAAIALNDMWVFDPSQGSDGAWKWVSGVGENGKHTGTMGGTPAAGNTPSARHQGAFWKDKDGKFWVFGGQQIYQNSYTSATYGNDLWKFDPMTEEWSWISGDLPTAAGASGTRQGSYPVQLGDAGMPRGRGWPATTVDLTGNLWMFGGTTNGAGSGFLGDIWKYDIAAERWLLIWGDATPDAPVNYNGQSAPGTPGGSPGARHAMAFWSDAQGNIWIYGGHNAGFFYSDLWKFDITTLQWTWMSGSAQPSAMPPQNNNNGNGIWRVRGVPSADRYPGKRYGMASFQDKWGRFWLHGGRAASGTGNNCKNDLWMFDPQTLQWTWMEGDSTNDERSVLGAVGVQDPSYIPSGRISASMGAVDTAFNFWLFGGNGRGTITNTAARNFIGDLWKFFPTAPPACTLTAAVTTAGPLAFCAGDSVLLKANQVAGASYEWKQGSNVLPVTADSLWVKNSGVYQVTLTDQVCSVPSSSVSITVHALPSVSLMPNTAQAICPGDSMLLKAAPSGMSYEWSRDGNAMPGSADSVYVRMAGAYSVKVTNTATGCSDTSSGRVHVSMHSAPVVTLNVSGTAGICAGDSLEIRVTSATSGYSFQWYHDGVSVTNIADRIHAHQPGYYNVLVTEPVNGCRDTAAQPVQLTVHVRPTVSLAPSGNTEICQGDQIILTASGTAGVQYQWKNGGVAFGGVTSHETVSVSGQYYVVVTDANQCRDSSVVAAVTVRNKPVFSLDPWSDTAFCDGGKILCTVRTNDVGLSYQWVKDGVLIPSATLDYYEISTSGIYEVSVTWSAVSGCGDTSSAIEVIVFPEPQPDIQYDGSVLSADAGYASYQWYQGAQVIDAGRQRNYKPAENGAYSVVVTDSNGCEGVSRIYNVNNVSSGVMLASSWRPAGIYPNPVYGGTVFFRYETPVHYILYSLEGKILQKEDRVLQADVSALPDGMYLLRIESNTGELLMIEQLIRQAK